VAVVRELITMLSYRVNRANIIQYRNDLKNTAKLAQKIGRNMVAIGTAASVAISAPLAVLAKKMKDTASAGVEIRNRFDVVFSSIREESNKTADQLAKDFDLAGSTARKVLAGTGDILVGFGYDERAALNFSDDINRLAGDLASFYDTESLDNASKSLSSGILGNVRNLRRFGVVIRQDTKEFKDLVKQMQAQTGLNIQAAKARVIFNETVKQSTKAMGDYARTRHTLANQERALKEDLKEMREEYGKHLLPLFLELTKAARGLVKWLTGLSDTTKKIVLAFGALAIAIPPILVGLGMIITAIAKMALLLHFKGLVGAGLKAMLVGLSPIIAAFAKILLIIGLIGLAIDDVLVWKRGGKSVIEFFLGDYETAIEHFKTQMMKMKEFVIKLFTGDIKGAFKTYFDAIDKNFAFGIKTKFGGKLLGGSINAVTGVKTATSGLKEKFMSATESQREFLSRLLPTGSPQAVPASAYAGVQGGGSSFREFAKGLMPVTINVEAPADSARAQTMISDTITNAATQVARQFNTGG